MVNQILPIGLDDFPALIKQGFYYVDKTAWIAELLRTRGLVNLFTRPRRFGKTLNMTTLKAFFEIGTDPTLFNGLDISREADLCRDWMGQYPVVYLTLKDVGGKLFDNAYAKLSSLIKDEAIRFKYLLNSPKFDDFELLAYKRILYEEATPTDITNSLHIFSNLLSKYYDKNVIVLIDEYDVPLDKAFNNGYYDKMIELIRDLLSKVLKSNTYLKFAVLTGALRISKESIFTGLNNPKVDSVTDSRFDEYFGFTDTEVKRLLADYDLQSHYSDFRECYDGYRFGETDIYCPWDVLNHSDKLLANPKVKPASHWINSSSNDLVRKIIDRSDAGTKDDIETLISGAAITKEISQELTYNEIETSLKSLWSVLLMTGYLTVMSYDGDQYELVIPNREVKDIYIKQIREWFTDKIHQNRDVSEGLYAAFLIGDSEKIEELLNGFLAEVFSVNDMRVANELKELYFHGMLVALLGLGKEWTVRSNPESGDGFVDVFVKRNNLRNGFVIEIKQTDNQLELEKKSEDAMKQLEDKEYATALFRDGVSDVWTYGIAFYKKRCKVIARHADSPKR